MKKLIALLLTAVSLTVILAGCSKGSAPTKPEDVKGETFEGGNISALVPEGWMAFHGTDYFDEYEEGYDPNVIQVCKGAKTEWDLLSKPYVMMTYFSPDNPMYEPSKDYYEEGADLEPFTTGSYTWKGFTAKSLDTPIAILWTGEYGEGQIQLMICLENGEKISLDDVDVQAILTSISINKLNEACFSNILIEKRASFFIKAFLIGGFSDLNFSRKTKGRLTVFSGTVGI